MGVREIVSELDLGWVKEAMGPRPGWENRVDRPMFNFYKAHKAKPRVTVTGVAKGTRKATPYKALATPTKAMGTPTRGGRGRK
jgi:hypothetical protein